MWRKIKIDEKEYLLKHVIIGSLHKIYITDLIQLWFEDVEEDQLLLRCKDSNKLVEASNEVFQGYILSLLESEMDNVVRSFSVVDKTNVLTLMTNLDGFKFKIKFSLKPASSIQFYEEVTRPMLTVVSELERRQQLLVDVINSKDLEILEYKLEGGQISRKAVQTAQFDLEAFSVKCAEDISATKTNISCHPSQSFTPLTQDLMVKISAAPILLNTITVEETQANINKNLTSVRLKSPSKNKKPKMYEDDDDDEKCDKNGDMETKTETASKIKQEISVRPRLTKGKSKPRLNKVLPNL